MRKPPELRLCVQAFNCAEQGLTVSPAQRARLLRWVMALDDAPLSARLGELHGLCKAALAPGGAFDPVTSARIKQLVEQELQARGAALGRLRTRDFHRRHRPSRRAIGDQGAA